MFGFFKNRNKKTSAKNKNESKKTEQNKEKEEKVNETPETVTPNLKHDEKQYVEKEPDHGPTQLEGTNQNKPDIICSAEPRGATAQTVDSAAKDGSSCETKSEDKVVPVSASNSYRNFALYGYKSAINSFGSNFAAPFLETKPSNSKLEIEMIDNTDTAVIEKEQRLNEGITKSIDRDIVITEAPRDFLLTELKFQDKNTDKNVMYELPSLNDINGIDSEPIPIPHELTISINGSKEKKTSLTPIKQEKKLIPASAKHEKKPSPTPAKQEKKPSPTPTKQEKVPSTSQAKQEKAKEISVKLKAKPLENKGKNTMQILEQLTNEDLPEEIPPSPSPTDTKIQQKRPRARNRKSGRPRSLPLVTAPPSKDNKEQKLQVKLISCVDKSTSTTLEFQIEQACQTCQDEQEEQAYLSCLEEQACQTCHEEQDACSQTEMTEQLSEWCQTELIQYDNATSQTVHINTPSRSTQTKVYSYSSRGCQTIIEQETESCQTEIKQTKDNATHTVLETADAAVSTIEMLIDFVTFKDHRREISNKETQHKEELNQLKSQIQDAQSKLEEQLKKTEAIRQQKQEVVRQELLYEQQLRQVKAELKNTETQLQIEKRDTETLNSQKDQATKNMEGMSIQLTSAKSELDAMKARMKNLETDVTTFKTQTDSLQKQLTLKTDELSSMTTTVLGTDRQRLKLEDELKEVQLKLKDADAERSALMKDKEEIFLEREEELTILQEAVEEALQEKEELEAKFEKFRTVNSCREQQLLDDFEWKLRELEQSHKRKMKEQEAQYEEKIKNIKECVKSELEEEIKEAEKQKKIADEELQKGACIKRHSSDDEDKIKDKLKHLRNQINSEWEERFRSECERLENIHCEDKQKAIQKLVQEKEEAFNKKTQEWEQKETELLDKITTLTEQEKAIQEELAIRRSQTDQNVYDLRVEMNEMEKSYKEQIKQLQDSQQREIQKLKDEQAEANSEEMKTQDNPKYTQALDKIRACLEKEQQAMLDYIEAIHKGELNAVNTQLDLLMKHSKNLKAQLKSEKENAEDQVKQKEEELKNIQDQLNKESRRCSCSYKDPPDPGARLSEPPTNGSDELTESGFVNQNWDSDSSEDENDETFLSQDAEVEITDKPGSALSESTVASSPDCFQDSVQTLDGS